MARRFKPDSKVSYRLEERVDIGDWFLVGTPEWLTSCFQPEYLQARKSHLLQIRRKSDLAPVFGDLKKPNGLTIDTESSGERVMDGLDALSPTSRVLLFQIGYRDMVGGGGRTFVVEPKLIPEFQPLLEDESKTKILQNAVHDYRFLYAKYGVALVNIFCTMLAEQLLTAGYEGVGVGLADLVRKYPPSVIISKNVREEFIQHSGSFTAQQIFYAARDIFLLPPVARAQYGALSANGMVAVSKMEFENIAATAEMGLNGVLIDVANLRETRDYHLLKREESANKVFDIFNAELVKAGEQTYDLLGVTYERFNLGSTADKKTAFARLGITLESTEVEVLEELGHPMSEAMIEWSGHNKVVSTYGDSMIERVHWFTNRFHPDFDQLGAGESAHRQGKKETIATGRYSSNFQILPRPEKTLEPLSGAEAESVGRYFAAQLAQVKEKEAA